MIDLYIVSIIVFTAILGIALYKDRKNIERSSIFLLRRTKKGKKLIKRIANISPTFWKWVGNAGIVICFIASIYITYFIVESLFKAIIAKGGPPVLNFVVPSISQSASFGPGYFAVPFWYWIISLALVVLVHEGMHGIMTIVGKTKIKSIGWGILAILPLAFVEPDERQLTKKSLVTRLRVYAAGSLSNFIFAFIYLGIFIAMGSALFFPAGVAFSQTIKGYPADSVNMTPGIITMVNDYEIHTIKDLSNALELIGENETTTIIVNNSSANLTYKIKTAKENDTTKFTPDWSIDFLISIETNFQGTVDNINSLTAVLGAHDPDSWEFLEQQKEFWKYAMDSSPAIRDYAATKLAEINEKIGKKNKPGFIGILGISTFHKLKPEYKYAEPAIDFGYNLLFFLFLLNFGIGLANLLPIVPFDGGKMWDDLFKEYIPEHAEAIMKILSWFVLIVLIAVFAVPFIPF